MKVYDCPLEWSFPYEDPDFSYDMEPEEVEAWEKKEAEREREFISRLTQHLIERGYDGPLTGEPYFHRRSPVDHKIAAERYVFADGGEDSALVTLPFEGAIYNQELLSVPLEKVVESIQRTKRLIDFYMEKFPP